MWWLYQATYTSINGLSSPRSWASWNLPAVGQETPQLHPSGNTTGLRQLLARQVHKAWKNIAITWTQRNVCQDFLKSHTPGPRCISRSWRTSDGEKSFRWPMEPSWTPWQDGWRTKWRFFLICQEHLNLRLTAVGPALLLKGLWKIRETKTCLNGQDKVQENQFKQRWKTTRLYTWYRTIKKRHWYTNDFCEEIW